jgi:NAD(P)-dependent dehydrogenase (short-subunit alcohol dehydrogenase family)
MKLTDTANAATLLTDRAVLVTGAGDGIGRAVAMAAAAGGARVALLGRTLAKLEATYDAIVAAGSPQPSMCQFELKSTAWGDYEALVSAVDAAYGCLDGLVHCAGMLGRLSPVDHYDAQTWMDVVQVNLNAPFLLTKACLPLLRRSQQATIVFTSSTVGRRGRAFWGAYAASKFGVEGLMQVLADELEANGRIRVCSINPGATRTAMRRQAYPHENPDSLPTPEQVAPAYLRLFGASAETINGRAVDAR